MQVATLKGLNKNLLLCEMTADHIGSGATYAAPIAIELHFEFLRGDTNNLVVYASPVSAICISAPALRRSRST